MMNWRSLENNEVKFSTENDPHGWIQFKGTDLCMDVRCKCGHLSHVDGLFVYVVECPECHTIYELNGHIQLIEREKEEIDIDITTAE